MILGNVFDVNTGEWRSDANTLLSVQEFYFAIFLTILYVIMPRD